MIVWRTAAVLLVLTAIAPCRSGAFAPAGEGRQCFGAVCNATASAYPERRIRRLLRHKKALRSLFGSVVEPMAEGGPRPGPRSPLGGAAAAAEERICDTRRVTIFPKIAYDLGYHPRYIVNVGEHVQSVSFETCAYDECLGGGSFLNYKTFCRQLYNVVRLLYVSEEGKLAYGKFQVPSTCVCVYKRTLDTL